MPEDFQEVLFQKIRELGGTVTKARLNYIFDFPGTDEERRAKLAEAVRLAKLSPRK
jgi:hypothetical protein